jgi:hypothetical protein
LTRTEFDAGSVPESELTALMGVSRPLESSVRSASVFQSASAQERQTFGFQGARTLISLAQQQQMKESIFRPDTVWFQKA